MEPQIPHADDFPPPDATPSCPDGPRDPTPETNLNDNPKDLARTCTLSVCRARKALLGAVPMGARSGARTGGKGRVSGQVGD